MAKYYTLATLEDGIWGVEFGSWDKNDVVYERECACDRLLKKHTAVFTTDGSQAAIDSHITDMNSSWS